MTYLDWFEAHAAKHRALVDKLLKRGYCAEMIVEYFDFDNMVDAEPKFCPLYAQRRKCHEMERLNCYLCACPNFRFNDAGLRRQGAYLIKSECVLNNGSTFGSGTVVHHDCSGCTVPHHAGYVREHFDTDWKAVMRDCPVEVD